MPELKAAIHSILKDCFRLDKHETMLILADHQYQELAGRFYKGVERIGASPYLTIIPESEIHQTNPLSHLAQFLMNMDAAVFLTGKSLSHTRLRRQACRKGTRIAGFPGVTAEMLIRNMNGSYKKTIYRSRKLADVLTIGSTGKIISAAGTDLTFSLKKMKGYADTSMLHESGRFTNMPFGEASISPVEGTTHGILIIDGSFSQAGLLKNPIKIHIHDGIASRISGGKQIDQVRALLKPFGQAGRQVAEIGIGCNENAFFSGNTLEDAKKLGTLHLALGNNIYFGGKNDADCHFDGIILDPTLIIDGKTILEKGILLI